MDFGYLFAALVWGSIGMGFFIYSKKQRSPAPLAAGLVLMAASYFAHSALTLSIAGTVILLGLYLLNKLL